MRGAIAAGHPLTAEAGARMLQEGGNAVDACLAAAFVSWVAESPLTGPGGGGFLLVHSAADRRSRLLDFFVTLPGEGLRRGTVGEMETVDVDFESTVQAFLIGPASVAVPGVVAGLDAAHRKFGTVPWATLLAPAIELTRSGIDLTKEQAYLHAILDIILRHTEEARAIYGPEGERLVAGDRLVMSDLAETLELLASEGASAFSTGRLARAVSDDVRSRGGTLTREDLAAYRPIWRRPISIDFLQHRVVSNPPPSAGGVLIAYGLRLLDRAGLGGPAGAAGAVARLGGGVGGQNDASGSGVVVPGTGIHLNNMLGEFDLIPAGARRRAGGRLTSMMAPSIVLRKGRPRLVVGSAGSLRLRGAILQIVLNAIGHDLPVEEAIDAPRVHLDDGHVHCEGGSDPTEVDELERRGYEIVRWRRRNLYFGGASAVEVRPDGTLHAAGDPRRGGHGIVVDG